MQGIARRRHQDEHRPQPRRRATESWLRGANRQLLRAPQSSCTRAWWRRTRGRAQSRNRQLSPGRSRRRSWRRRHCRRHLAASSETAAASLSPAAAVWLLGASVLPIINRTTTTVLLLSQPQRTSPGRYRNNAVSQFCVSSVLPPRMLCATTLHSPDHNIHVAGAEETETIVRQPLCDQTSAHRRWRAPAAVLQPFATWHNSRGITHVASLHFTRGISQLEHRTWLAREHARTMYVYHGINTNTCTCTNKRQTQKPKCAQKHHR
jgi:hypothetical protein